VEQFRIFVAGTNNGVSIRKKQLKIDDVIGKSAVLPVVLCVGVRCEASTERDAAVARTHIRHVAARREPPHDIRYLYPGFGVEHPGALVEGQHTVQPGGVHQQSARIHGRIAIAKAGAARQHSRGVARRPLFKQSRQLFGTSDE
jgi:hypothetical protein